MPDRERFPINQDSNDVHGDYESPKCQSGAVTTTDFDVGHVRKVVAGNPNTPKQVLARLAEDSSATVRRRVAENPRTPVEVLLKLAQDDHCDVRLAIAENPSTPPDILSQLADDVDMDVRYGVAENPHMPEDILIKLTEDDNPYIRCRALKTLQMMAPDVQSRVKLMMQPQLGDTLRYGEQPRS